MVGTSRLRPQRLRRRPRRPRARSFERRTTSASTGGTRRSSPRGSGRRTTAPAIGTSIAPASRNISKTSISGKSYWSRKCPPVMRSLILILHQDKVPPLQNDSLGLTTRSSSLFDQNSETVSILNQNVVVFGRMLCRPWIMLSSAHEIILLNFPGSNCTQAY